MNFVGNHDQVVFTVNTVRESPHMHAHVSMSVRGQETVGVLRMMTAK